jgi:hypothetical protein
MSDKLLSRRGAREITQQADRLASLVQNHHDLLGIDPKIARDYALKTDMISDMVETTAVSNFPREAAEGDLSAEEQKTLDEDAKPESGDQNTKPNATSGDKMAVDEEGGSLGATNGGWDPTQIADQVPGPLEIITPPSEPWMGGEFTQKEFHELGEKQEAGVLPAVDKFASYMDRAERVFSAASKMPEIAVQGFSGFTDQIRELEELTTQAQELAAQVEALIPDELLKDKKEADKSVRAAQGKIKKAYKENLTQVGNITIERKTQLVEARAMLKVTQAKAKYIKDVQAELIAAAVEQYGEDVGEFIKTTLEALQDAKKSMSISFKGFELEQRAMRTAGLKEAGLADLLTRFQEFVVKSWKRIVSVVENGLRLVMSAGKTTDKSHKELMGVLKAAQAGKLASSRRAEEKKDDKEEEESKKAASGEFFGFNPFK